MSVAEDRPDVLAPVPKLDGVIARTLPAQAHAGEEPSDLPVLPADRPDVRLDLRVPDALEAFQLSDRVPGHRGDHPSMLSRSARSRPGK
jgi:hypothetical protein